MRRNFVDYVSLPEFGTPSRVVVWPRSEEILFRRASVQDSVEWIRGAFVLGLRATTRNTLGEMVKGAAHQNSSERRLEYKTAHRYVNLRAKAKLERGVF